MRSSVFITASRYLPFRRRCGIQDSNSRTNPLGRAPESTGERRVLSKPFSPAQRVGDCVIPQREAERKKGSERRGEGRAGGRGELFLAHVPLAWAAEISGWLRRVGRLCAAAIFRAGSSGSRNPLLPAASEASEPVRFSAPCSGANASPRAKEALPAHSAMSWRTYEACHCSMREK